MRYPILITQTGHSTYCVSSPDIDCCVSAGDSIEDAVSGFRQALEHYIRDLRAAGGEVPEPRTLVDTVEVGGVA